ncbi:hypothetical protein SRHO_G00038910 [Serrasalmus rhombeus]
MLYLLGIIIGLIGIIVCMTKGLSQDTQRCAKDTHVIPDKKKKNFSEQELHFITKILSIGLVDADPNTLHHLKEYRDLQGSST